MNYALSKDLLCIGKMTSDFFWHIGRSDGSLWTTLCAEASGYLGPCQLICDAIIPRPMKPGRLSKEHYEYIWNSTCRVFLAFEPLAGKRHWFVRSHLTMVDYTDFMKIACWELCRCRGPSC